jgi:hypothetical protein
MHTKGWRNYIIVNFKFSPSVSICIKSGMERRSWGSPVSIVTSYGLRGWGSISGKVKKFLSSPQRPDQLWDCGLSRIILGIDQNASSFLSCYTRQTLTIYCVLFQKIFTSNNITYCNVVSSGIRVSKCPNYILWISVPKMYFMRIFVNFPKLGSYTLPTSSGTHCFDLLNTLIKMLMAMTEGNTEGQRNSHPTRS